MPTSSHATKWMFIHWKYYQDKFISVEKGGIEMPFSDRCSKEYNHSNKQP